MSFQDSEDKLHLPNRNDYLPHFGCLSNLHMRNILGCVLQGESPETRIQTPRELLDHPRKHGWEVGEKRKGGWRSQQRVSYPSTSTVNNWSLTSWGELWKPPEGWGSWCIYIPIAISHCLKGALVEAGAVASGTCCVPHRCQVDTSLQREAWGKEGQVLEVDWTMCPEAGSARLMDRTPGGMGRACPAPCRTEPRRKSFDLWFPTMTLKQSESHSSVNRALHVLDCFFNLFYLFYFWRV